MIPEILDRTCHFLSILIIESICFPLLLDCSQSPVCRLLSPNLLTRQEREGLKIIST